MKEVKIKIYSFYLADQVGRAEAELSQLVNEGWEIASTTSQHVAGSLEMVVILQKETGGTP
jgi:hypothetical protein